MKRRNSVANLPSLAEVDAVLSLVVPEIEQNISFFLLPLITFLVNIIHIIHFMSS